MIRHGCVDVAHVSRIATTRRFPRLTHTHHASVATTSKKAAKDKGEAMMSATIRERFSSIASALSDIDSHGNWKDWEEEVVTLEKKVQVCGFCSKTMQME